MAKVAAAKKVLTEPANEYIRKGLNAEEHRLRARVRNKVGRMLDMETLRRIADLLKIE